MEMKEPNFLVIGAGKSGTTSLYEYLNDHPEVFMSQVKETNFFALEGEELIDSNEDPEQMHHYPWSVTEYGAYQELFADVTNEKAVGEVSPMYMYSDKAALSIKERLPKVKLIAILRQPVDRLYSRYMHLARENRTPTSKFEDALDENSIWWKRNDLVQEGFYHSHLNKYFELFPKDQIKIVLYEDFRSEPKQVLKEIYDFIGVDSNYLPNVETEFNVSGLIKNKNIDYLIGQNSMVKQWIQSISPPITSYLSSNKQVKAWTNKMRNKNLNRPSLSQELKGKINEIYKNEIDNLQSLINRDLTHWQQF